MEIRLVQVGMHLEGCLSLKEKRQRLSGLKTRLGQMPQFAICESDHADLPQSAEWSILVLAANNATMSQHLNQLEQMFTESLDALITHFEQLTL
ncbi:DUF503 family protein [Hahella ganghwensis]|uniref:DUF503 family protein n=1 Tax=Hahella ganghwensis TaxID=286420 RepID=UPI0003683CAB|nr:DUF503 family protein [Hahella ganghwensis]